jgi:hypothetical protein
MEYFAMPNDAYCNLLLNCLRAEYSSRRYGEGGGIAKKME